MDFVTKPVSALDVFLMFSNKNYVFQKSIHPKWRQFKIQVLLTVHLFLSPHQLSLEPPNFHQCNVICLINQFSPVISEHRNLEL